MSTPLFEAVNKLCGELPENCKVNLIMEKGSAYVEYEVENDIRGIGDTADMDLSEQLLKALDEIVEEISF